MMKKIAELIIGSQIVNYKEQGTPTAFISYDSEHHEYKAYCAVCNSVSYFNWRLNEDEFYCPACGHHHHGNAVMFNHDKTQPMPYAMRITLVDFKDKLELRLTYDAIKADAARYHAAYQKVQERFVFDMKSHDVYWTYDENKSNVHQTEKLGYISSFDTMRERTALWYIAADHVVRRGTSLTALLRMMRTTINRHMKELGFQEKRLFISSQHSMKVFASVLAMAHKVRFWDADLVPYGGKGDLSFPDWLKKAVKGQELPENWESNMEARMKQGMTYDAALIEALKLPNTPFVRKHLHYEDFYPLVKAFSLPTIDLAYLAFPVFSDLARIRKWTCSGYSEYTDGRRDIEKICEFVHTFYPRYPHIKASRFIQRQWSQENEDTLHMWKLADATTLKAYEKEKVPFRKLHDWLSVAITKQENREVVFQIDKKIIEALHQSVDGYQFHCVERKSELKKIAMTLRNCSLSYATRMNQYNQLVVVTDDDGNIMALLEIQRQRIVQAKLFANKQVSTSDSINRACADYSKRTNLSCQTRDIDMEAA
ncbi:TFIIB-type zinc finger domain-containing protein [Megasphaera sp. NM10]|uniref:TFIIB-type zinc finger domain-containing protein n=1 Tax=Megasphaera sp. NM10 TaxID=1273103 RepID=UPI001EF9CC3C|nr:TFIIB-type zinc finger domain-containing protein [Megasphaera sp. NM10]